MPPKSVPVIIIHQGNQDYLRYCLLQAKQHNSNVILLGDNSFQNIEGITFYNINEFESSVSDFRKFFNNYSTYNTGWIRFAFERLFILRDFMIHQNYHQALMLDSDCMLYANASEAIIPFQNYDMTVSSGVGSQHCLFINDLNTFSEYIDFTINIYKEKKSYYHRKLISHFIDRVRSNLTGGACEMNTYSFFIEKHPGQIFDTSGVSDELTTFDHGIGYAQSYETKNGIKHIQFKNNIPYCYHTKIKKNIQFKLIHFQGYYKDLMKEAFEQNKINYHYISQYTYIDRIKGLVKKILVYLKTIYWRIRYL